MVGKSSLNRFTEELPIVRPMPVDYHWPGLAIAPIGLSYVVLLHGQQKWTKDQRALQTSSSERYSGYGGDSRW
jgi:hypothetical protein